VTTRQLFSISTASDHGYKLPMPNAMAQSIDRLHKDSFPVMKNTPFHWPQTPSTHGKVVLLPAPEDSFQSFHSTGLRLQTSCTNYRNTTFPCMEGVCGQWKGVIHGWKWTKTLPEVPISHQIWH